MSKDFIKMVSEITSQRYAVQMNNLIANKIPCGLFCGFTIPQNGVANINVSSPETTAKNVKSLRNSGFNITCVCVIDNPSQMGGVDVPVLTLEEFANFQPKPARMLYFPSRLKEAFLTFFTRFNVRFSQIFDADYLENLYNFYLKNLPALYSAYEMFADGESRKVFLASVVGRLTRQFQDYRYATEPQYFLEGFLPTEGDIAIDGGAYDGATSRDFAMQGAKVYAFEMSAENYQNCLERAEKYNFTLENLGLSAQEGEEFYTQNDSGSRKGQGDLVAHFIDLDTYVIRKNLQRVDYIKLDIEGAELDMLHGAAKTISRWKPKMAVCAYHKPEDLWTLANYIKALRPDYEFYFRHYLNDFTEGTITDDERAILRRFGLSYLVPTVYEMVLYCR